MASIQATRLKKGMLIKMEQDLFRVLELQHVTPGNLRGFVRVKLRNIRNGALSDQKLRSEDTLERATLDEREMQYLYQDGDDYLLHGHDVSYEQIHISSEALGDSVNYLKPEMTIQVEFYGEEPVGIELPQTVDLKVLDTAPGIKGATASAQVKPATLETGLVVQVPPFVNTGDLDPRQHRDRRVSVAGLATSTKSESRIGLLNAMDVVRQPIQGWIEVIVGSMFSGKSEELIRRLRRAQIARQKVQIFKPAIDTRYSDDHIVSHSEMRIASRAVEGSRAAARRGRAGHRGRRHRRGAVLRPGAARRCATRWPTAASA